MFEIIHNNVKNKLLKHSSYSNQLHYRHVDRERLNLWLFVSLPPIKNFRQVRRNDVIQVSTCKRNLLLAKFIEQFYDSVLTKNNILPDLIEHRNICKRDK